MTATSSATDTSPLFSSLKLRGVTLANRLVVSPMCMYSARNGLPTEFHMVHLGQFALGGAGLILTEATAVSPEGRISPEDLGLWSDEHIAPLGHITDFVHDHGGLIGTQLAHAGRKASTYAPWRGEGAVPLREGGWQVVGPDDQPFLPAYPQPRAMTPEDIQKVITDFEAATRRAMMAGFDVVEIHAAHGYLLHQFLSPLSNSRGDQYGGSFENRTRLVLEVTRAVRRVWPIHLPLFVRLSATDWAEGGWDLDQTVELCRLLKLEGVDVIDVSSGGLTTAQRITVEPGYQVPFAARVRQDAGIETMAVGLITTPEQAEQILRAGQADLIAFAREFLRDPHLAQRAALELGASAPVPNQYARAQPRRP
ncbi:NADH:flavin oxidoreductase/NADH oxidase [Deinococcus sonorensis]|uniref:NADH:flavin oxidoreductase/NADH oxidase n=2 Tax=Deinococcus sonorensis TaxID=309891 RepID=A0AAU7U8W2_9DEIO